jgi:hypothetical protein
LSKRKETEAAAPASEKGKEEAEKRLQVSDIEEQKGEDWMHMATLPLWQQMRDSSVPSS